MDSAVEHQSRSWALRARATSDSEGDCSPGGGRGEGRSCPGNAFSTVLPERVFVSLAWPGPRMEIRSREVLGEVTGEMTDSRRGDRAAGGCGQAGQAATGAGLLLPPPRVHTGNTRTGWDGAEGHPHPGRGCPDCVSLEVSLHQAGGCTQGH